MITHVVCWKLKDRSRENAERVREKLLTMQGRLPMLKSLEVGVDVVRSGRSFDVVLIARFDSLDDLNAYQVHPYHQEIAAFMGTVADQAVAVDFEG